MKKPDIVNTQGTANKNRQKLEKAKIHAKRALAKQRSQLKEQVAEPQQTKDQKMWQDVSMQTTRTNFKRTLPTGKESGKEKKHGMTKQLKDTRAKINEYHKQEQPTVSTKTKTKG